MTHAVLAAVPPREGGGGDAPAVMRPVVVRMPARVGVEVRARSVVLTFASGAEAEACAAAIVREAHAGGQPATGVWRHGGRYWTLIYAGRWARPRACALRGLPRSGAASR